MTYAQIQLLMLASDWKHPLKNVGREFTWSVSQRQTFLYKLLYFENSLLCVLITQGGLHSARKVYQGIPSPGTVKNQVGESLSSLTSLLGDQEGDTGFLETIGVSMTTEMKTENTVSSPLLLIPQLHVSPRSRNEIHRKSQSKEGHVFLSAQQMASAWNSLGLHRIANWELLHLFFSRAIILEILPCESYLFVPSLFWIENLSPLPATSEEGIYRVAVSEVWIFG